MIFIIIMIRKIIVVSLMMVMKSIIRITAVRVMVKKNY